MMDLFYGWVKNIAFYLILITAVMNVVPNNSYKKYIKFITGMILVILLVAPLTKLLNLEELLDMTFQTESYKQEVANVKYGSKYLEQAQSGYLTAAYEKEAEAKVKSIVRSNSLYPVNVQIQVEDNVEAENFGMLNQVTIIASYDEKVASDIAIGKIQIGENQSVLESYEVVNVKKEIEDFYNISGSNINISIQR